MKTIKLFLILGIFFTTIIFTNANNLNILINENIDVNELGGGQVEIIANGNIYFQNPTLTSLIYEYDFKFKDELNFQLILNNTNNINLTYSNKKIHGNELKPNENKSINYQLKGIIPKTQYNDFYQYKKTIFEWYLEKQDFSPLRFATLNKLDKLKNYSNGTFERYVIVEGNNPSEFNVEILYLDLYKTQSTNNISKIMESQNLLDTFENISLKPNQTFNFKTIDENSNDKTTYWIEYDIIIETNINSKFILNYYSKSGSGGSNSNDNQDNKEDQEIIIEKPLIFNKKSDKYMIGFSENLNIYLEIQNPNNLKIENLLILDEINEKFKLIEINQENSKINNNKLSFVIDNILPYETKIIEYKIKFDSVTENPLLYFPPSKLSYKNENIYSNSLNIINDVKTTDRRLFVQKEIKYLNSTTNRVYIKVKNIGEIDFENLIIVENDGKIIIDNLNTNNKNKWVIPKLKIGEEWITFYDVKIDNVNKYVPEVYGAENAKIYKTIILNEKIGTLPIQDNPKTYQKIIIGVAVLLLIIDIVF